MEHDLNDWRELASFIDNVPVINSDPLRWYNSEGNLLSPDELITLGYWGVRPATIPSEYNPNINKLEEVELIDCERDIEKRIIIRSYNIINLTDEEIALLERKKRDLLLEKTDRLVYPDLWEDLSPERRQEIKLYRKDLRDVPQQSGFPRNINWPNIRLAFPQQDFPEGEPGVIIPLSEP